MKYKKSIVIGILLGIMVNVGLNYSARHKKNIISKKKVEIENLEIKLVKGYKYWKEVTKPYIAGLPDETQKGVLPFTAKLPRYEIAQTGWTLRQFERGGLVLGLPSDVGSHIPIEDKGNEKKDSVGTKLRLSERAFGTKLRLDDHAYGKVYVNKIGEKALLEEKIPNFAVNTVIVREKLTNTESDKPELIVVMIKREKGFNPQAADWQFLVFDGQVTQIQSQHNQSACLSCHSSQKNYDFVFRDYLPYLSQPRLY